MPSLDTYPVNVEPLERTGKVTEETLQFKIAFNFTETDTLFDPFEISIVEIYDEGNNLVTSFTDDEIVNDDTGIFHVELEDGTVTAQTLFDIWSFKVSETRATIKAKLYTEIALDTSDDTQVKLNHNYGGTGELCYKLAGTPIEAATIRVTQMLIEDEILIGITTTDENGNWVAPIYVDVGYTYNVYFQKLEVSGPDKVTLVI